MSLQLPPSMVSKVVLAAAVIHNVPTRAILSPSRRRAAVTARHYAMRIARSKGYSLGQIGQAFDRDHATVRHACLRPEDISAAPAWGFPS